MEISIFKEKENIYFSIDGEEKQLMNFDNLVVLSEKVIDIKENFEYEIKCNDGSLELYKSTIEELINSLLSDTELLELLAIKNDNLEEKSNE